MSARPNTTPPAKNSTSGWRSGRDRISPVDKACGDPDGGPSGRYPQDGEPARQDQPGGDRREAALDRRVPDRAPPAAPQPGGAVDEQRRRQVEGERSRSRRRAIPPPSSRSASRASCPGRAPPATSRRDRQTRAASSSRAPRRIGARYRRAGRCRRRSTAATAARRPAPAPAAP